MLVPYMCNVLYMLLLLLLLMLLLYTCRPYFIGDCDGGWLCICGVIQDHKRPTYGAGSVQDLFQWTTGINCDTYVSLNKM